MKRWKTSAEPTTHLFLVVVSALAIAALMAPPSHAIINGKEPESEDRRFDAVGAFSRTDWLTAGKQRNATHAHNWFGAATLISPNTIITARHLLPNNREPKPGEFSVRFRRHVLGGLGRKKGGANSYHHVRVVRWIKAVEGDLAIGILKKPVLHIQPIQIDLRQQALVNVIGLLAGWGSESRWLGVPVPRRHLMIGENRFAVSADDAKVIVLDITTENRVWKRDRKRGTWKRKYFVTSDSAVANRFDSGGAMLVEANDKSLRLVGVITSPRGGMWLGHYGHSGLFPPPAMGESRNENGSAPQNDPGSG